MAKLYSIKKVINVLEKQNYKAFFNLSNVFNYIQFKPIIEFNIHGLNSNFRDIITQSTIFDKIE